MLKMDLSQTAKLLYALLLDRSTLSQKNGWQDDKGRVYIVYPIAEIAEMLDKGSTAVKSALNELDAAGLLERKRTGFSAANQLFVKVPDTIKLADPAQIDGLSPIGTENRPYDGRKSDPMMDGKQTLIRSEKRPYDGRKSDPMMVGKPTPNKTTINNLTESKTMGVSGEPPAPFGKYKNIFLSEAEYGELKAEYPGSLDRLIEEMSGYLAANGKSYENYAAALRRWADKDKKDAPKRGIPDYTFKEGESL